MGVLACKEKILTFSDQTSASFVKFPEDDTEAAQFWSEAWFEAIKDLIAPPIALPPVASKELFASTMMPEISKGGLVALSKAAVAAFPLLAAAIAPNVIASPPPAPFLTVLAPAMAPFIDGTTDTQGPALAFATALQTWIATGFWSVPAPPAPTSFTMGS